jgi:serine protease Do
MNTPLFEKKIFIYLIFIPLFFLLFLETGSAEEKLWTESENVVEEDIVLSSKTFRELAKRLSPAVVNIRAMIKVRDRSYGKFPYMRPPSSSPNFPPSKDFEQGGEGTGFIINKSGYILTNGHVVAESDQLQVTLADKRLFPAKLIGLDKTGDLALVKIESNEDLPVAPLGSSEKLQVGDWVMAIGSPFGFDETVTVGIISGKGRSIGASPYDDFIQTDASVNPGNSGGPLINLQGEVVGINTAILSVAQGMGFSIPIDVVKIQLPNLKKLGRAVRSWLGIVVQDITLEAKKSLGLKLDHGSLVNEVVPQSPASKAGIQRGDVIVEFDKRPIKNSIELPKRVAYSTAEKEYSIKLVRNNETISIKVILEEVPKS